MIWMKNKILFHFSFKKLSETMLQVQNCNLLNSKKQIMSNFYFSCSDEDQKSIRSILNFIRDKPKTGLANKSLVSYLVEQKLCSLEKANSDFETVIEIFFQLDKEKNQNQNGVSIQKVEHFLEKLKQTQGKGSIKNRLNMLTQALEGMSPVQKKVLFRILSKKLRIGLTQKSFDFKRQKINSNETQDQFEQDYIKVIYRQNGEQLMLAKPLRKLSQIEQFCKNKSFQGKIYADLKYDGERTHIIYRKNYPIQLISRNGKSQISNYLWFSSLLQKQLEQKTEINSIQIDGEIVCVDKQTMKPLPMQILLTKRGKIQQQKNESNSQMILVYGFDVLEYNGEKMLEKPLKKRRSLLPTLNHLYPSKAIEIDYPECKNQLLEYFHKILHQKYQGLILKGENDIYCTNGSRRFWAKMKKGIKIAQTDTGLIDLDLVVMGANYGEGKRSKVLSTYLVGTFHEGKLYPVSRIGSGFSDELLEHFTKIFQMQFLEQKPDFYLSPKNIKMQKIIAPKYVFKIHCQDITRSPHYMLDYIPEQGGLSLRFPIFQEVRFDKEPKHCTSEQILSKI